MSHACVDCGMVCYCDMEDHEQDQPDDCTHECADANDFEECDFEWLDREIEREKSPASSLTPGDTK